MTTIGEGAPPRFPLRLPSGWQILGRTGAYLAACTGSGRFRPTLFYTDAPGAGAVPVSGLAEALCHDLPSRYEDALVLDVEPVTCRGGLPGMRVLSTHTQDGRGLTTEHWFVQGTTDQVHVLAAVVPTSRYAELTEVLHQTLRSFREW